MHVIKFGTSGLPFTYEMYEMYEIYKIYKIYEMYEIYEMYKIYKMYEMYEMYKNATRHMRTLLLCYTQERDAKFDPWKLNSAFIATS